MQQELPRLAERAQLNRHQDVMLMHPWMLERGMIPFLARCLARSIAEHLNCSAEDLDVMVAEYDDGTVEVTIAPAS